APGGDCSEVCAGAIRACLFEGAIVQMFLQLVLPKLFPSLSLDIRLSLWVTEWLHSVAYSEFADPCNLLGHPHCASHQPNPCVQPGSTPLARFHLYPPLSSAFIAKSL
ncbi:SkfA peptide export ATP-binding protein SkfE, partial [Clarias magur]